MKIVIDCNVLISAGLTNGTCRKALIEIAKNHKIYCSEEIFQEWAETIKKKKFAKDFKKLKKLVLNIAKQSNFIKIVREKGDLNLPDKKDEIYLRTAFSAGAKLLIIGNLKHFPKREYCEVEVINPSEFCHRMSICLP